MQNSSKPEEEESKTWPQYLSVLTALLAMFSSGIHFGWPSPSIPKILSDQYPFEVTSEAASYITIIGPLGDIVGCVGSSLLVDIIGRKPTITLIAFPQIVSFLMIYFSTFSPVLLYVARFIGGFSEGACFTILPIYIGEVAEPKIRGVLGGSFSCMLMGGILFANIVGTYLSLQTAALVYLVLPLVFLVTFSCMPESPYYLIMKNKIEAARLSLSKLRRKKNVEFELSSLISDVSRQMTEQGRYKDLILIQSNKNASIVLVGLRVIQQFSGVSSFTVYYQLLFKEATDAIPEDLASMIMLVLQTIFATFSIMIVDRLGRKPLLYFSIGGCLFSLTLEAVFFILKDFASVDTSSLSWIPLLGMIVFISTFAMGLGCVVNLMMGELFPASIKAKALGLMTIVFAVSMFVATKFYQYMTDNYSLAVPFVVFAACQLLGLIFCYRYIPETKGKTLEQIQQQLKGNKQK